jgi:hypothetical protein
MAHSLGNVGDDALERLGVRSSQERRSEGLQRFPPARLRVPPPTLGLEEIVTRALS